MKVKEVLFEFSPQQDALLRINQVVPHMASAGIPIDVANVAKFTNMDSSIVGSVLSEYLRNVDPKSQAGQASQELHAVIALGFLLKNNQLKQSQISHEMLEQVTGVPYNVLYQTAEANLAAIQNKISSFRMAWITPHQARPWASIPKEEQTTLITKEADKMLANHVKTITAKEIASALINSQQVAVKEKDSLRRSIDAFLSSNHPDALRLNLRRPVGKTYRTGEDITGAIKVW